MIARDRHARAAASPPRAKAIFYGVLPFIVTDVVRLIIMIAFTAIALYLPSHM